MIIFDDKTQKRCKFILQKACVSAWKKETAAGVLFTDGKDAAAALKVILS